MALTLVSMALLFHEAVASDGSASPDAPPFKSVAEVPDGLQSAAALRAFQSGASLRPLVMEAIADPGLGRALYAMRALQECHLMNSFSTVRDLVLPEPPMGNLSSSDMRRRVAVAYFQRRCEELPPAEIVLLTSRVTAVARDSPDAYTNAERRLLATLQPDSGDARQKALGEIFATKDPVLLDSLGVLIGLSGRDEDGALLFRFEGVNYRLRDDRPVAAAVALVPCELGLRCDAKDSLLGLHCAETGNCPDGRYDVAKNGVFKDDPAGYERATRLAGRMARAIREGDVAAFSP